MSIGFNLTMGPTLTAFPASGGGGAEPPAVPAAVYRFNGDLTDAGPGGYDLTNASGTPANLTYAAGRIGQAASAGGFAGVVLRRAAQELLAGVMDEMTYTVSAWVFLSGSTGQVVEVTATNASNVSMVSVKAARVAGPLVRVSLVCAGISKSDHDVAVNAWHHVALCVTAGTGVLYVDGAAVASGVACWGTPGGDVIDDACKFEVRLDRTAGTVMVDDVGVVQDVALTADQITDLWAAGAGAEFPLGFDQPVRGPDFDVSAVVTPAWWFRSESGQAAAQWDDSSGNDRHAVQATAGLQPTLLPEEAGGWGVLRFAGDWLQTGAFARAQPVTVFTVLKLASVGRATASFVWDAGSSGVTSLKIYQGELNQHRLDSVNNAPGQSVYRWLEDDWCLVTQEFDGASSTVRVNGRQVATGGGAAVDIDGITLGANFDGSNLHPGVDIAEQVGAVVDDTQRHQIELGLAAKFGLTLTPTKLVVVRGDSITTGDDESNGGYPTNLQTLHWPGRLLDGVGFGASYFGHNFAVSSTTTADMLTDVAEATALYDAGLAENTALFMGATNDVRTAVALFTTLDNVEDWFAAVTGAGFVAGVMTIPSLANGTHNVARNSYNRWVRENWPTFADFLIDAGANTYLNDATNTVDGVHWDATGSQHMADEVAEWWADRDRATGPTGLTATAGDGEVVLDWADLGGASGYQVFRRTAAADWSSTPLASPSVSTYTDDTVTNGVTYHYFVRGVISGIATKPSAQDSATPSSGDVTTGILGWWNMEEDTGVTKVDSSGNNQHWPDPTGASPRVTGKVGYGVSLGSASNYRLVRSVTDFLLTTAGGISLWAKQADLEAGPTGEYGRCVLAQHNSDSAGAWQISVMPDGAVRLHHFPDGALADASVATPAGGVTVGQWHHIVVTWEASGATPNYEIWVDGVSQSLSADTVPGIGGSGLVTFYFDADYTAEQVLDLVGIYDRKLASGAIAMLYNGGDGHAAFPGGLDALEAAFSGSPLTGDGPLEVTFADESTGGPTAWLWQKNDGTGWVDFDGTPTAQHPTEEFAAGTWSVRLAAMNSGGTAVATEADYVDVTFTPSASPPPSGSRRTRDSLRTGRRTSRRRAVSTSVGRTTWTCLSATSTSGGRIGSTWTPQAGLVRTSCPSGTATGRSESTS